MARLDPKMMRQLGIVTASVSQWTLSVVCAVLLGRWLDQHFGTEPILLVLGAFLGFVIGGYAALQSYKHRNNDSSSN